jgi:hypothetical protein
MAARARCCARTLSPARRALNLRKKAAMTTRLEAFLVGILLVGLAWALAI